MKVALLVRVSSKSDRQDYDRQINDLTRLCDHKGWEIVETIKGKFSATKTPLQQRKDVQRLFDLVSSGKIQKVLVSEISRLGRRASDTKYIVDLLTRYKVSIFIQDRNIETISKDPETQFIINIILSVIIEFAELETHKLSYRIRSGIKKAIEDGRKIGRPAGSTIDFAEKVKTNEKYKRAARALRAGDSLRKAASFAGVSVNTVRKIKANI